jgi:hypothetical protein
LGLKIRTMETLNASKFLLYFKCYSKRVLKIPNKIYFWASIFIQEVSSFVYINFTKYFKLSLFAIYQKSYF